MHDRVEATALDANGVGQAGKVFRRRAFKVDRIDRRGRRTERLEFVVQRFERAHLAPGQNHRGSGARTGERAGPAETATGTGHEHDPFAQRIDVRLRVLDPGQRQWRVHALCTSRTIRSSSPLSNSSSVMSQPPISSPAMNS